jgi:2-methylcitrate dehydratase PrpD
MQRIEVEVDPEAEAAFPRQQLGRTTVELTDGRVLESPLTEGLGNHTRPLTDRQGERKFHWLVAPILGPERSHRLYGAISGLHAEANIGVLSKLLRGAERR